MEDTIEAKQLLVQLLERVERLEMWVKEHRQHFSLEPRVGPFPTEPIVIPTEQAKDMLGLLKKMKTDANVVIADGIRGMTRGV